MRLVHLSDLHLGKRLNGYSLLEDQRFILDRILEQIDRENPDAVLIAGDVYDKPVPPAEAVQLFDGFLTQLAERRLQVFILSGNHDSPERIAFGGRLMDVSGIHLSPVYDGRVQPFTLTDGYGPVRFWLLPWLKPANVRRFFPEASIETWTDAMRVAIEALKVDPAYRNVLVAHAFVTGAGRSDSEEVSVGGADNVDAEVFEPFDYTALGHLHAPQSVGRETLRYCGTPLKYSFSEEKQTKSLTVVDLAEKGSVTVRCVPLTPMRDLRTLRGTYEELTLMTSYQGTALEDYVRVVLTDEQDVPDAMLRLQVIYPNLMQMEYDNARTRATWAVEAVERIAKTSPQELFEDFYTLRNGQPMTEAQRRFVSKILEELEDSDA